MADACNPGNYPIGFDLLASYVDGICATDRADPVRISSMATDAGNVGDCEPDNPPPAMWVHWVQARRAAGVDPTIYCADDSLSSFFDGFKHRDVAAAFSAAGVAQPHYWLILPGATSVPDGAVAVQVANVRGLYDVSLVADYWPGVDKGDEMTVEEHNALMAIRDAVAASTYNAVDDSGAPINLGWAVSYGLSHARSADRGVAGLVMALSGLPAAVVAALPPAQAGGITIAQVQAAVTAAVEALTFKASA